MARGEFSVYQFFDEVTYERTEAYVDPETAVLRAKQLIESAGARIGTTRRVIVTDGGDFCCFEWIHGKGIVFPPQPKKEK